jgi:hypothetical protein
VARPTDSPSTRRFNAPFFAHCDDPKALACTAMALMHGDVFEPSVLAARQHDVQNRRTEFYDDMQGQRTGAKTNYIDFALGWQHWFSPQIEIRPEVAYYLSLGAPAFNGNFNAMPVIPPNKRDALIAGADLIWHF